MILPINKAYYHDLNSLGILKTVDEIVRKVLNGAWGNGEDRKNWLTAAGYSYSAVQARVNELMK